MSNRNPQPAPERIILGIDPGTTIMGYGVIRCRGKAQVELVAMGALHHNANFHYDGVKTVDNWTQIVNSVD